MKKEITPSIAALASLVGLGVVGAVIASGQAAASGQQSAPPPVAAPIAAPADATTTPESPELAYKGPTFSNFIAESYQQAPDPNRPEFYAWMQNAYDSSHVRFKTLERNRDLDSVLDAIRQRYVATNDPEAKALLAKQTGAFCHKLIKRSVKRFSLDHGFEFYNMVDHNQRQCFLQSIVIAGMLQRAGMSAGVVMVTKSDKGQESNNGHAVTLVKLANGNDLLVDASHKTPFIKQQGLMIADATTGNYRFVAPQYAATGDQITGYAPMNVANETQPTASARPLSIAFLHSQFDYYRGERTPGGFSRKRKPIRALPIPSASSRAAFRKTRRIRCPRTLWDASNSVWARTNRQSGSSWQHTTVPAVRVRSERRT